MPSLSRCKCDRDRRVSLIDGNFSNQDGSDDLYRPARVNGQYTSRKQEEEEETRLYQKLLIGILIVLAGVTSTMWVFSAMRADSYRPSLMFVKLCLTHGSLGPRRPISDPRGNFQAPKCQGVTTSFPRGDFDATHLWHCRYRVLRGDHAV